MNAFHFAVGNRAAAIYEANRPKNLRPLNLDRCYIGGRYRFSMDIEQFQTLGLRDRFFRLSLEKSIKNNPLLMEHLVEYIDCLEMQRVTVGAQEKKAIRLPDPPFQMDPSDPAMMSAIQQPSGHPNPPQAMGSQVPAMMGTMEQQHAFGPIGLVSTYQASPPIFNAPISPVNTMDSMPAWLPTPPMSRNNSPRCAAEASTPARGRNKRAAPSSAGPSSKKNCTAQTSSPLATTTMSASTHLRATPFVPTPAPAQQIQPAVAMAPSPEEQQTGSMIAAVPLEETLITTLNSFLHPETVDPPAPAADPADFMDDFINWQ